MIAKTSQKLPGAAQSLSDTASEDRFLPASTGFGEILKREIPKDRQADQELWPSSEKTALREKAGSAPARVERNDSAEKARRLEFVPQSARPERSLENDRADRSDRSEAADRPDRADRWDRSEAANRPERSKTESRPERGGDNETKENEGNSGSRKRKRMNDGSSAYPQGDFSFLAQPFAPQVSSSLYTSATQIARSPLFISSDLKSSELLSSDPAQILGSDLQALLEVSPGGDTTRTGLFQNTPNLLGASPHSSLESLNSQTQLGFGPGTAAAGSLVGPSFGTPSPAKAFALQNFGWDIKEQYDPSFVWNEGAWDQSTEAGSLGSAFGSVFHLKKQETAVPHSQSQAFSELSAQLELMLQSQEAEQSLGASQNQNPDIWASQNEALGLASLASLAPKGTAGSAHEFGNKTPDDPALASQVGAGGFPVFFESLTDSPLLSQSSADQTASGVGALAGKDSLSGISVLNSGTGSPSHGEALHFKTLQSANSLLGAETNRKLSELTNALKTGDTKWSEASLPLGSQSLINSSSAPLGASTFLSGTSEGAQSGLSDRSALGALGLSSGGSMKSADNQNSQQGQSEQGSSGRFLGMGALDRKEPSQLSSSDRADAGAFSDALSNSVGSSSTNNRRDLTSSSVANAPLEKLSKATFERIQDHAEALQARGSGLAKIQITDPMLGSVNLQVAVGNDGRVHVKISSDNEKVKSALEKGSEELKSSLQNQNITLGEFRVVTEAKSVSNSSDLRQPFQQNQNPQEGRGFSGFGQGQNPSGRGSQGGFAEGDSSSRRNTSSQGRLSGLGSGGQKRNIGDNSAEFPRQNGVVRGANGSLKVSA